MLDPLKDGAWRTRRGLLRAGRWWLVVVVLLGATGCERRWGPFPLRTAKVEGRVVVGGRPLTRGWLEFLPINGTVGNLTTAEIGPDGRFRSDRVAVGTNAMRIVGAKPVSPVTRSFAGTFLIRRDIPAEGLSSLEIDLQAELILMRR